jgi:proteasome lid subunit RPN8/RPN11
MLSLPPAQYVTDCPYTRGGLGVCRVSHAVLSALAGAVHDREEWILLLTGQVLGPQEVQVSGYRVPQQSRSHGDCSLSEEEIGEDVVGVLHSHHTMGAFMSTIDARTLNPRFPLSIVISSRTAASHEKFLGFSYQAVGRGALPCGSVGQIEYRVIPDPLPADWPEQPTVQVRALGTSLGSCPRAAVVTRPSLYTEALQAECGAEEAVSVQGVFGRDGTALLDEIRARTTAPRTWYAQPVNLHGGKRKKQKKGKSGALALPHWSDVPYEADEDEAPDLVDTFESGEFWENYWG